MACVSGLFLCCLHARARQLINFLFFGAKKKKTFFVPRQKQDHLVPLITINRDNPEIVMAAGN
jgi:hypothetical protein